MVYQNASLNTSSQLFLVMELMGAKQPCHVYVYRENSQDSTRHCQVSATWPLGYGLLHTWETKDRRKLDGLFSLLVLKLLEGVHCCLITRLHTCKEKKGVSTSQPPPSLLHSKTKHNLHLYLCIPNAHISYLYS